MKRVSLPLALAAAAVLWQSVTPAQAICLPEWLGGPSLEDSVNSYPIIVVVQVIGNRGSSADVIVERYLKGTSSDMFSITSYSDTPEPLSPWGIGGRAVVFLPADPKGANISIGECQPTFRLPRLGSTEQSYESYKLSLIEHLLRSNPETPTLPFAAASIAIPLVFLLAASFVFPAKGSQT